jgi:hypothetical protein
MCGKCRANTALAKELAKEISFPGDSRSADDIWWSDDIDRYAAEEWGRRAFRVLEGLKGQGFMIEES